MSNNADTYIAAIIAADAAGTLAPFPAGWTPPTANASELPEGFLSAPNEKGRVRLTQVENDRGAALASGDINYIAWAQPSSLPEWYAIADTKTAFVLTPEQSAALVADIGEANVVLPLLGNGAPDYAFQPVDGGAAGAYSDGDLDHTRGVHLSNLANALARQRAHAKAVDMGGSGGDVPWVAVHKGKRQAEIQGH